MKYYAIKLVSKVFKRKIAIRDWKRFHHFGEELYGNINEKTLDGPKQFSSFAKCTTIEEKLLALKPKNLDFVQAAGLPRTIETTYDGLGRTGFSVGKSILVLGGVGGVGSLVI
uniref:Uncharacterized protein n=1 Tax=Vitis vinifera TaxID=29760 RepID=F6HTX4_VITVI